MKFGTLKIAKSEPKLPVPEQQDHELPFIELMRQLDASVAVMLASKAGEFIIGPKISLEMVVQLLMIVINI